MSWMRTPSREAAQPVDLDIDLQAALLAVGGDVDELRHASAAVVDASAPSGQLLMSGDQSVYW